MLDLLTQLLFALAGTAAVVYGALQFYKEYDVPMWIIGVAEATILGLGAWVAFVSHEWVYFVVFAFFAVTSLIEGALFADM